jgi:TonB-dependent receptor
VVSSARIQEVPDANAAESIGRLPGVSVLREGGEGNKVVIRGLSPKFNNITVDGVKMGATGMGQSNTLGITDVSKRADQITYRATDRSSDLSMISPNMLDGIEVVKAITPDMDADVIGGSVNFKLKEAESGVHYDVTALGGYNNLWDTHNDYKLSANVNTRFFDDKLGVLVQGDLESRNRGSNELSASYRLIGDLGDPDQKLVINNLILSNIMRDKRRGGGLVVMDYRLPNGKISTTNLLSHTTTNTLNRTEIYETTANDKLYNFTASRATIDVFTNKLEYVGDFDLLHVDARVSHAYSENDEPENRFLNFYHRNGFNNVNTDVAPWLLPDLYKGDLSDSYLYDAKKFANISKDREITGNLDLTYPFSFSNNITVSLKTGGKYGYKDKSYKHSEAGGNLYYSGGAVLEAIVQTYPWMEEQYSTGGLPITTFWDDNVKLGKMFDDKYYMEGKTYANLLKDVVDIAERSGTLESWNVNIANNIKYNYSGNEYALAGYFMADVNFGKKIEFIPGFRYEQLTTSYKAPHGNSAYSGNTYPHIDTTVDKTNGYFLPIVHLRYKPVDWFDVRFAYTNTLSYPDFSSIIPIIDVGLTRVTWNNPSLKAARSQNYDIYMSFYENTLGLLTIGGFYKEIKDLIVPWPDRYISDPADYEGVPSSTKGYRLDTYINNPNKGTIKGVEIDWQTRFWYLPSILSGFVLNVNYTHITSETKYPNTVFHIVDVDGELQQVVVDTFYTNRMLEQPDDIVNVSLGYDYKGFSINVSMIYQSNIFKRNNFWEKQWNFTDDYTKYDIVVKQDLPFYGMQVFTNFNNITAAKDVTLVKGNGFPSAEQEYDMTIDLGLRMRL